MPMGKLYPSPQEFWTGTAVAAFVAAAAVTALVYAWSPERTVNENADAPKLDCTGTSAVMLCGPPTGP